MLSPQQNFNTKLHYKLHLKKKKTMIIFVEIKLNITI